MLLNCGYVRFIRYAANAKERDQNQVYRQEIDNAYDDVSYCTDLVQDEIRNSTIDMDVGVTILGDLLEVKKHLIKAKKKMATINIKKLAIVKVQDALGNYRDYIIEAENLNEMRQALDVNGLSDYKIIESDTLNIQGILIKE